LLTSWNSMSAGGAGEVSPRPSPVVSKDEGYVPKTYLSAAP
jgi:hypothetical protein